MQDNTPQYSELTDEELIKLTQSSDEYAFTELMMRYSQRIWKIVIENSRQRRDAEEILMDTWKAVWENIRGLRRVKSFGGWLQRIAYNACKRYYTTASNTNKELLLSEVDLTGQIDQEAEARFRKLELCQAASESVKNLPEKLRNVAVLYYLEFWNINEIHEELGLAIGTIKTKLRQTRELLRKEFDVTIQRGRTMLSKQDEAKRIQTKIKVVGVGNAGCNGVKRMIAADLKDMEFYFVNTDQETIRNFPNATNVLIGKNTIQGLGAQARPQAGKTAAEEDREMLQSIVLNADIVIVIAGLGGGTGTGASPLIASLAREQGALSVGIVTQPFWFEGQKRLEIAEHGLQELRENADIVVVIPNQRIHNTMTQKLSIRDAFGLSDEMLLCGVKSILEFHNSVMRNSYFQGSSGAVI